MVYFISDSPPHSLSSQPDYNKNLLNEPSGAYMNVLSGKKQVGRYQIDELVGKGSTATIYKARDPILSRNVAVKVIHQHLSRQPEFIERIEREAKSLASLRHPHIINIYDKGKEDDIYYIVVELVMGETLKDRLQVLREKNQIMSLKEVERIMFKVCDAIDYIHRAGLIHRDIKPANIIFDEQNKPMLMDFGIVKIQDVSVLTAEGSLLGTPFYMSPEQCSGQPADNCSDIYSLGVMLYEMCTGDLPFKADSLMGFINAHKEKPPPSPRQINPQLSASVENVILRALAKSPEDRFSIASELADGFSATVATSKSDNQPAHDITTTIEQIEVQPPQRACFRSDSSGEVYQLDMLIDNHVGRTKSLCTVEVDISSEIGSDYVHSDHAIVRYGDSDWELIPTSTNRNPTFVNNSKISPGDRAILFNGDRVSFSGAEFVFEITH